MSTTTTPTLPTSQRAILFNTSTHTLSLTHIGPIPLPSTHKNEHLITVHSTAITNGELTWAPWTNWPLHHVPCFDVSGTILSLVPGSPFKIGDKVFGRIHAGREGAARKFATILPSEAALVPSALPMVEAATVPMSAHTAWQALFEQGLLTGDFEKVPYVDEEGVVQGGELAKGKRVLILGAAGGVGLHAVQFAKLAGAYVAGTASSKNTEFLKGLGIDEVIDYHKTSIEAYIAGDEEKKFDLVLDGVGGKSMLDGWNGVKKRGVYVSIAPGFQEPEGGKPEGVRSLFFVMEARGSELAEIGKFYEKGLLRTSVDSVWKLEEYEKAFEKTASGHARGKVVLKVAEEE